MGPRGPRSGRAGARQPAWRLSGAAQGLQKKGDIQGFIAVQLMRLAGRPIHRRVFAEPGLTVPDGIGSLIAHTTCRAQKAARVCTRTASLVNSYSRLCGFGQSFVIVASFVPGLINHVIRISAPVVRFVVRFTVCVIILPRIRPEFRHRAVRKHFG